MKCNRNSKCLIINVEKINPNSGVAHKVQCQYRSLRELFDTELLTLKFKNRLARHIEASFILPIKLLKMVLHNRGCIIYYRYSTYRLVLNWLFYLLKNQCYLFVEVNTKIRDELMNGRRVIYLLNELSERIIYKAAYRVLPVTQELGDYVHHIAPHARIKVIGNGYDTPEMLERPGSIKDISRNQDLTELIASTAGKRRFIWAGNPAAWHGLDKIDNIIAHLKGSCLYLVGDPDLIKKLLPSDCSIGSRVFLLGKRNLQELAFLYQHCHFGCGVFALERKNMREAVPLKVREYLYYGLPVIIGHHDPQLEGLNFVHRYRDLETLEIFLSKQFNRQEIMKYAKDNLSWRKIMEDVFGSDELRRSLAKKS
jgi:glycosyltransferase involved in cell wall biosynthesis